MKGEKILIKSLKRNRSGCGFSLILPLKYIISKQTQITGIAFYWHKDIVIKYTYRSVETSQAWVNGILS